jgi:phage shock protein C
VENKNDPEINFTSLENIDQGMHPTFAGGASTTNRNNSIIGGVCSSIADQWDIDPLIIRLSFILSIIFGVWGIVIYLIAYIFMPKYKQVLQTNDGKKVLFNKINFITAAALGLTILLVDVIFDFMGIFSGTSLLGLTEIVLMPFILVGMGILLIIKRKSSKEKISTGVNKYLFRSSTDKKLGGVCGGLSSYLNLDSNIIRLIWIFFSFLTVGLGVLVYLLFVIIVPYNNEINFTIDE